MSISNLASQNDPFEQAELSLNNAVSAEVIKAEFNAMEATYAVKNMFEVNFRHLKGDPHSIPRSLYQLFKKDKQWICIIKNQWEIFGEGTGITSEQAIEKAETVAQPLLQKHPMYFHFLLSKGIITADSNVTEKRSRAEIFERVEAFLKTNTPLISTYKLIGDVGEKVEDSVHIVTCSLHIVKDKESLDVAVGKGEDADITKARSKARGLALLKFAEYVNHQIHGPKDVFLKKISNRLVFNSLETQIPKAVIHLICEYV